MAEAANAAIRAVTRARRIPQGARCIACGCDNVRVLEAAGDGWRCYECASAARGRSTVEQHHVLPSGLAPETVPLPGNIHRDVSEAQREIPAALIAEARSNPLAYVIVILCGFRDYLVIIVRWLGHIIDFLRRLMEKLVEWQGPSWWGEIAPLERGGAT